MSKFRIVPQVNSGDKYFTLERETYFGWAYVAVVYNTKEADEIIKHLETPIVYVYLGDT